MDGKLVSLCREYIWWCLVASDCGGGYTVNQRRIMIHGEIADVLGVEARTLNPILHCLDTQIGMPLTPPEKEGWSLMAKRYGRLLYEKLITGEKGGAA